MSLLFPAFIISVHLVNKVAGYLRSGLQIFNEQRLQELVLSPVPC